MATGRGVTDGNEVCFAWGCNGTRSVEELLGNELGAWQKGIGSWLGGGGSRLLGIITNDRGPTARGVSRSSFVFVHRLSYPRA
jgi:hypothetical protein